MRDVNRLQHDQYGIYVLTDPNVTVEPMTRVQSVDFGTDFGTEVLYELGNTGYVQQKEDTPAVSISLSGNQTAQVIETDINPLQWLALLADGDTNALTSVQGDVDAKEVIIIGEPTYYHNGELIAPLISPHDDSDEIDFHQTTATKIAAQFYLQEDTILRNVSFRMNKALTVSPEETGPRIQVFVAKYDDTSTATWWDTYLDMADYYSYSEDDETGVETRWASVAANDATAEGIDQSDLEDTANGFKRIFNAQFTSGVKLLGGNSYAIVWSMDSNDDSAFGCEEGDYDAATEQITLAAKIGTDVSYFNGYICTAVGVWSVPGGASSPMIHIALGLDKDKADFDYYTSGDDNLSVASGSLETANNIPCTFDLIVPIRGQAELNRVVYYGQCYINSISFAFDVGGVATWDVGVEGDNRSMFSGDRKGVSIRTIEADVDVNAIVATTITLGGDAGTSADTLDFPSTEDFDTIFQLYLNGEELEQATTNALLNTSGLTRWAIPDTEVDQIAFTANTLVENDVIRIVYDPLIDNNWANYELTSEPGDQGGIRKGELDIKMITDTTIPRIVEGLGITASSNQDVAQVTIAPGACYLDVTEGEYDIDQPSNPKLELFREALSTEIQIGTTTDWTTEITTANDTDVITTIDTYIVTMTSTANLKEGMDIIIVDDDSATDWILGEITDIAGDDVTINVYYLSDGGFTLASGDNVYIASRYLVAKSDRYGNMMITCHSYETALDPPKYYETDVNADELLLAKVILRYDNVSASASLVYSVTDMREFHTNTLSLVQSAAFSMELSREAVFELGNKNAVDRSLTTPVPVTTDFTAKDSDDELYILLHQPDIITTIARDETNNIFATTSAACNAGFGSVSAGDLLEVRGSIGVVDTVTDSSNIVISVWYGGVPIDGSIIIARKGILKAREMRDLLGVQINLYDSDSRLESEKHVIFETIDARISSDTISISTGADGEVSASLTSANFRALLVADADILEL